MGERGASRGDGAYGGSRRPRQRSAEGVVIFYERQSTYHSKKRGNVYLDTAPGDYYATFGFLDGHAEGKSYKDANGYIAALHRPIRQTWFGVHFPDDSALRQIYLDMP